MFLHFSQEYFLKMDECMFSDQQCWFTSSEAAYEIKMILKTFVLLQVTGFVFFLEETRTQCQQPHEVWHWWHSQKGCRRTVAQDRVLAEVLVSIHSSQPLEKRVSQKVHKKRNFKRQVWEQSILKPVHVFPWTFWRSLLWSGCPNSFTPKCIL